MNGGVDGAGTSDHPFPKTRPMPCLWSPAYPNCLVARSGSRAELGTQGIQNNSRCGRQFLDIVNNLFFLSAAMAAFRSARRIADEFVRPSLFQTTNRRPSQRSDADHAKTNTQMTTSTKTIHKQFACVILRAESFTIEFTS